MILRKTVAAALCIAILCFGLASCTGRGFIGIGIIGSDDGDEVMLNTYGINFDGAYGKYSADDVVFLSSDNRYSATWDLVYYFICLAVEEIFETTGEYPDLSDLSGTGYRDQIMTRAAESILVCLAIEYAADAAGAEITDEDRASIALNQELAEEQEGGAKAFQEYLAKNHASHDVYLYLMGIDCLYENTILKTYGERAELFSDEDTAAFLEGTEYFTVKHIFFSTTGSDGITLLDDDKRLTKRDMAESVLFMLTSFEDGDFETYFDELMFTYSEDTTALNMYPDGYLFKSGEAYEALEKAAASLDIGGLSDVIETELGYHIVYRLPVNYDIVPQGFAWEPKNTLRSQAARDYFGQYVEDLRSQLGDKASGSFFDIDLAGLFKLK